MLNEERLEAGKGPIGFLNPIIYKHPEMFNDIVVGHNDGCGTDGFPTSPGWDPVTGHGTPRYEEMRKVFLALP
jgi:tripeptidyl-peptidase-1